jgi:hypothetical protein
MADSPLPDSRISSLGLRSHESGGYTSIIVPFLTSMDKKKCHKNFFTVLMLIEKLSKKTFIGMLISKTLQMDVLII